MMESFFPWPYLLHKVENGVLQDVDLFFAKDLLHNFPKAQEKDAALLCALMHATKNGHLCLYADKDNLESLFPGEDEAPLIDLILQGIQNPLEEIFAKNTDPSTSRVYPIYKVGNRLYFQKYWLCEKKILDTIKTLNQKTPHSSLVDLTNHSNLTEEQKKAIHEVSKNSITFLTGGPGTGKTYTSFYIAKILYESLNEEEKKKFSIILTAPTGKATEQLKKSFKEFVEMGIPIEASTLHTLLGVRRGKSLHTISSHLHASLIIVDECSMIDADLFSCLMQSLSPLSKVVFMGDPHQLPAVGVGSLFNDLEKQAKDKGLFGHAHLSKCLRSDRLEILQLAEAVKNQDTETSLTLLSKKSDHLKKIDLGFSTKSTIFILKKLIQHVDKSFIFATETDENPLALLESMDKIKILSCLRKGPLGVDAINQMLKEHFRKQASSYSYWVAPIMITENDKEFGLSNGQSGIVIHPLKEGKITPKAYFAEHNAKGYKVLPESLLPKYEYAYCISVHKSQGSEYDHVIFLAPKGSESFGKEVLYTALTRAKNLLEIDMDEEVFIKTMQTRTKRFSGIEEELF